MYVNVVCSGIVGKFTVMIRSVVCYALCCVLS